MRNFRELKIWKLGIEIAEDVYGLLPELPRFERYGLNVQMATNDDCQPNKKTMITIKSLRHLAFSLYRTAQNRK